MRKKFFISLYPNENEFHYSLLQNQNKDGQFISGKSQERNLLHLLNHLIQQHSKRWPRLYINFIVPMENIIIKNFPKPTQLKEKDTPIYLKEKLKELFHAKNHYTFDYQIIQQQNSTFLKTFIVPNDYWKRYFPFQQNFNIKKITAEPETHAIARYIQMKLEKKSGAHYIYVGAGKIYFHHEHETKIISSYDHHWLTKYLQYLKNHADNIPLLLFSEEEKSAHMKTLILRQAREERISILENQLKQIPSPFCLGGLLKVCNE